VLALCLVFANFNVRLALPWNSLSLRPQSAKLDAARVHASLIAHSPQVDLFSVAMMCAFNKGSHETNDNYPDDDIGVSTQDEKEQEAGCDHAQQNQLQRAVRETFDD
jgi:hypothetical protein